jgi:hypothetical protein
LYMQNSFFLLAGALLFDEKIRQSAGAQPYPRPFETPNRPPNIKCIVPAFFGDRFRGKYGGLCTLNPPAEEVR